MTDLRDAHLTALHEASKDDITRLKRGDSRRSWTVTAYRSNRFGNPVIPDPKLFVSLETLSRAPLSAIPTVGECAVHLELLEVFHALRVRILQSQELDTSFGVTIKKKTVYRSSYSWQKRKTIRTAVQLRDDTFSTRRREKWPYFLNIAVARFERWMRKADDAANGNTDETMLHLPPLDVLMVWHAFLLNPKDFERYCHEHGLNRLYAMRFPWSQIHEAIDSQHWSYQLPKASEEWSSNIAKVEPDLFQYLIDIGKTNNHLASVLSRYGSPSDIQMTHSKVVDNEGLTPGECFFLETLCIAERELHANKPLVDNVQRQASFVDKMHAQLWIRSPAVDGTLCRAIDRYDKFLQLFMLYPSKMLVPTLDVDLVWHTHQCSAVRYNVSMLERTGRFINHEDKLGATVLGDGMEKTKELFLIRFGEKYLVCQCWDCEAILSAMETRDEDEMLDETDIGDLVQQVQDDVEYYRAVELARRAGRPLPVR